MFWKDLQAKIYPIFDFCLFPIKVLSQKKKLTSVIDLHDNALVQPATSQKYRHIFRSCIDFPLPDVPDNIIHWFFPDICKALKKK